MVALPLPHTGTDNIEVLLHYYKKQIEILVADIFVKLCIVGKYNTMNDKFWEEMTRLIFVNFGMIYWVLGLL